MTAAAAQAAAQQLRTALLDNGVQRVSIELQPGVGPKADPWGVAPFVRGLGHHIASYPTQGATPGLGVVKGGRKGASPLQGPLANCYGGFDLTARIITLGWANHPGAGGPWSVPGWGTVPLDNGRPYILGWEFEGGYLEYTDEMHDFMARCGAGTLEWLGWLNGREPAPLECFGEHKDPWAPGRKIDRIGYTAKSGRARIAAVRGKKPTQSEEDDSMKFKAFRSDPKNGGTGAIALAAFGIWYLVPNPDYYNLLISDEVCTPYRNVAPNVFDYYRVLYQLSEINDTEMAAVLSKLSADEAARAAAS
ncbi:hypothetical protein [Blastococcus sp. CT_GayMR16]|uniref:hypothetical protein n=1 Tax=Blastococcus sp. CT_GayMR16 TaxID=2559607 RepID=UPI0010732AD2|nr:hypothetical protein [Blastococcus sp. CT_GayMR16]TFV90380.1 hypothetical protein E4P38_02770 [Blastococcus sp. CT_GayMR16]